ncbi:protein FAR1-RELATED SEQUENCE 5-like [Vigna unguiculata]|uniref:protein FAR1-RELATED SEQUENCE 5-like n=1 Tax=Vigna unguiculata TaxID=3917 RepID=UPI001016A475|nr:protein FAR1-RELATED SEQUENCE 5-like [Vigna unguiculata]
MEGTEPDVQRHPLEDAENECPISAEVVLGQENQTGNPCDSSVEDAIKIIDTENECTGPNVCPVDHSHIKINDECQTSNIFHDDKFHNDNVSSGELCENPCATSVNISMTSTDVKNEDEIYVAPKIGMEFESEDNAYKCYSMYGVLKGFSIRKDFVNKSRINGAVVSRRYTCHRQGYRPNKNGTYLRKFQQETRTGCLAHMTIARQPNGKFQVTHFETEHNHEFVTPCTAHMLPSQKKLSVAQAIEANLTISGLDETPKLGMGFDSDEDAYEFYNAYAGRVGFSVRKDYVNRSKIDGAVASRRFTCFREGFRQKDKRDMNAKKPRKDTRIGCLAQMVISRQPDGRYHVTHFEEKHNHELVDACRVHMLRSQQKGLTATQIEKNIMDGLPTSTSETNCKARLDYDPVNREYKLPFKCSSNMKEGDIEKIKLHFQIKQTKNPSFFYAFQVDADDQITNIFWVDTKMIVDYTDFGDVVCFDSSYKYYKDSRPFVPFLGINNHQQMTIFGAALLQNESVESLKWLFTVFLEAMSGRKPKTILTDLDVVTAEAINVILPQTNHRVCVWHVYQDALKHLSHVSAGSDSFVNDLRSCLFHHEEEDYFVNEWNALLDKYNLWENKWLQQIFGSRNRWAIAYGRQYFCADIESMLLRENLTGNLKRYLKHDSDILPLFKYLVKVVTDWHYKELEANYDMNQRMPPLLGDIVTLKHARAPYTPKIFELFQKEYEASLNLVIKHCTENGSLYNYKVSVYEQAREYSVTFDSSDETISCSCMKFEYVGMLCCHALKVLDYVNIRIVPSRYILKIWTKDARV